MKVAFFYWPAAWASGHDAYQTPLLQGLLAQDRHQISVVADSAFAALPVPPPHSVASYRRRLGRAGVMGARDLGTELPAARAVRATGARALIAAANFSMPRVPEVPLLATLYETEFFDPTPWHWYSSKMLQQMAVATSRSTRAAAAVFPISEYTAARASSTFALDSNRVVVAYPSVLSVVAGSACRAPRRPYVAQVGWFHPRKDLALVVEAWACARRMGLEHDLVLIGRPGPPNRVTGPLARQVLEHAAEFVNDVHVVGLVSRGEYEALLAGAAALLVGSHQEGFCVPVIEAFSAGTPVVAVSRASLTEVAGPVGVMVEPEPTAFAKGIMDAVCGPTDVAALEKYAGQFSPANQVRPFLDVLDAIEDGAWPPAPTAGKPA